MHFDIVYLILKYYTFPFFIFSNVSIDGTAVTKLIGIFSNDALEIAISLAL